MVRSQKSIDGGSRGCIREPTYSDGDRTVTTQFSVASNLVILTITFIRRCIGLIGLLPQPLLRGAII
jgi:hypothetical protein